MAATTNGSGAANLPKTMRALVLTSRSSPATVEVIPTPHPTLGSAIVRIHAVKIISYAREVFNGTRPYPFPTPLVPGSSAIGHIAATGPDTTKLKVGDLVFVDTLIRGRDDSSVLYLAGVHEGFSQGSQKLMQDVFRDWTLAEYCRAPLENLARLDERRLTGDPRDGGLGFELERLCYIGTLLVPYGGLKDIELQAGQTVIGA